MPEKGESGRDGERRFTGRRRVSGEVRILERGSTSSTVPFAYLDAGRRKKEAGAGRQEGRAGRQERRKQEEGRTNRQGAKRAKRKLSLERWLHGDLAAWRLVLLIAAP
jgi:hypothetical protein